MPRDLSSRTLRPHWHAFAAAIAVGTIVHPAQGCLWEYGTDARGNTRTGGRYGHLVHNLKAIRQSPADWQNRLAKLRPKLAGGDYKVRNDYAVALIHLGRADEAVTILRKIEAQHPGLYATAANLGTAYELAGDNERALKWIETGIQRNPDSHAGSEWVHVKILEAKLALAKDPEWLQTHSVLGIDFGNELVPTEPPRAEQIRDDIIYQLRERLQFVEPPDPIVASLLADLANLIAINEPVEHAIPVYRFALEFQPARTKMIERRLAHFEGLVESNLLSGTDRNAFLLGVVGIVLVLVLGIFKWMSGRSKQRQT